MAAMKFLALRNPNAALGRHDDPAHILQVERHVAADAPFALQVVILGMLIMQAVVKELQMAHNVQLQKLHDAVQILPRSDMIEFMDGHEQSEWLTMHIPHRVRAAIARLNMEQSLLRVKAIIEPQLRTDEDKIYWRCSTDSIWEGRLAATRWLIGFVGIKQDNAGNPAVCKKVDKDVRIDDFDGGRLLGPSTPEGRLLAAVWKGCSQASSHATNEYGHPSVSDKQDLPEALKIILDHLQKTI